MNRPDQVPETLLCIDIGSRTQDALLFTRGETPANATRFVLPSPALLLARRIAAGTETRRGVYLHGQAMGGGFLQALIRHLDAGCPAAIHPRTVAAFAASPANLPVERLMLCERCPDGFSALETGDVNVDYWRNLCRMAGLDDPPLLAVAAQDHGEEGESAKGQPGNDSSGAGMTMWRDLLHRHGGAGIPPEELVFTAVPPYLARLTAIQAETGGPVADSAAAALLGLLGVPAIAQRSHREGVLLVNAGNSHTTAFLVFRERVFGVYEHHTLGSSLDEVAKDFVDFRLGWLPHENVRAAGGHGVLFTSLPPEAEGFKAAYITGPQRDLLRGLGQMAAAFDDIAQNGCFGLLRGLGYL